MSHVIFSVVNSYTPQDCFPVRIKGIYAINCPPLVEFFIALFKPFLKSKLLNRVSTGQYFVVKNVSLVQQCPVGHPENGGTRSPELRDQSCIKWRLKNLFVYAPKKETYLVASQSPRLPSSRDVLWNEVFFNMAAHAYRPRMYNDDRPPLVVLFLPFTYPGLRRKVAPLSAYEHVSS